MKQGPSTKRTRRASLVPVMALIAVAACAAIIATSLAPGILLRAQQKRELAQVRAQLAGVKADNRRLSQEVTRLSDPSYVEVIARDRYNLAKPGERVFKVIDVPAPAKPPTTTVDQEAERAPFWRSAWRWLVGG